MITDFDLSMFERAAALFSKEYERPVQLVFNAVSSDPFSKRSLLIVRDHNKQPEQIDLGECHKPVDAIGAAGAILKEKFGKPAKLRSLWKNILNLKRL